MSNSFIFYLKVFLCFWASDETCLGKACSRTIKTWWRAFDTNIPCNAPHCPYIDPIVWVLGIKSRYWLCTHFLPHGSCRYRCNLMLTNIFAKSNDNKNCCCWYAGKQSWGRPTLCSFCSRVSSLFNWKNVNKIYIFWWPYIQLFVSSCIDDQSTCNCLFSKVWKGFTSIWFQGNLNWKQWNGHWTAQGTCSWILDYLCA